MAQCQEGTHFALLRCKNNNNEAAKQICDNLLVCAKTLDCIPQCCGELLVVLDKVLAYAAEVLQFGTLCDTTPTHEWTRLAQVSGRSRSSRCNFRKASTLARALREFPEKQSCSETFRNAKQKYIKIWPRANAQVRGSGSSVYPSMVFGALSQPVLGTRVVTWPSPMTGAQIQSRWPWL